MTENLFVSRINLSTIKSKHFKLLVIKTKNSSTLKELCRDNIEIQLQNSIQREMLALNTLIRPLFCQRWLL